MITGAERRVQIRLFRPSPLLYLSFIITLASLTAPAAAVPGFWQNIYDVPTPSPEDGPPGSRHASRDKRLLPYQICGILGGYLGFVLAVLLLLLTVGRRLRRNAQMSPASLEMELIKSTNRMFVDETPISPASTTRGWFKGAFRRPSSVKSGSTTISPVADSFVSFDRSVIDNDKEVRQREMERLYAAVMEHDARKSQTQASEHQVNEDREGSTEENEEIQPVAIPRADKRPPAILVKSSGSSVHSHPRSPISPVKAIYPPGSPRSFHSGPRSPAQHLYPLANPMSPRKVPLPSSPGKPSTVASPRSVFSLGSGNKTRKALKNLRISAPIKDYPGVSDQDEARTPLSARFYTNLPPPPSPPKDSADYSTTTTPRTLGGESEYAYEELDKPQPLPVSRLSRGPLSPGFSLDQPIDAVLTGTKSGGSSTSSLPFRSYQSDLAVPPTPTKVTYVERRKEKLSLVTPRTGVPSTPYSPYMPFTPITPVTPHLISKKEMKARKKMEGRRVMSGEDLVKSDDDMWE